MRPECLSPYSKKPNIILSRQFPSLQSILILSPDIRAHSPYEMSRGFATIFCRLFCLFPLLSHFDASLQHLTKNLFCFKIHLIKKHLLLELKFSSPTKFEIKIKDMFLPPTTTWHYGSASVHQTPKLSPQNNPLRARPLIQCIYE